MIIIIIIITLLLLLLLLTFNFLFLFSVYFSGESPLYKALVDKNKTVVHLLLFSGAKTSSEEEREKMAALLQGEVTQARSLLDICVLAVRAILISVAGGKSIENRVRLLPVSLPLKELLMLK